MYVLCLVSDAFLNLIYSQSCVCMVLVRGNWFGIRIRILFQRHSLNWTETLICVALSYLAAFNHSSSSQFIYSSGFGNLI